MDLWERGVRAGLVRDVLVQVRDRESQVDICVEEEEDFLARSFHGTLLSGKLL